MKDIIVLSTDEQMRIAKLRETFRTQLQTWMAGIATGVRYSPGVARALAESCIEIAIVAWLSGESQLGADTPEADAADAARSVEIYHKLIALLEHETAH